MQQNAKQFLESKGLKDTLYNVEDDNDTWIKGGLSKLLDEYHSQTTSEEYKLETGDGYGTTYAASQPPHGTASGGYSLEDMKNAYDSGVNEGSRQSGFFEWGIRRKYIEFKEWLASEYPTQS